MRVAISGYVDALNRYDNEKTRNAYRTPVVKHLLPFLAYADKARTRERPLREVDGRTRTSTTTKPKHQTSGGQLRGGTYLDGLSQPEWMVLARPLPNIPFDSE